jgi:TP901 family phage tail tape measure protein
MAITEEIVVGVDGLGSVNALADALDKAAASAAKLRESMAGAGGGAGAGGADKLAAAMDAAAGKISAAVSKIEAAMDKLAGAGDAAAAGIERLDEAAAAAEGSLADAAAGADMAAAASDRLAESADAAGAALDRQALAGGRAGKASAEGAAAGEKFWKGVKVLAIGGAVAAAYGIDKAMKLQTEVTRLYTAAGLKGVKPADVTASMLAIGSRTGFSGQAIAEAMYHPVSAGLDFKTAKLLTEQSANLANIHGANLEDTTYAMSSVMKAYNEGAKQVVPTAALLNSIVGQGDMRFQDFNESVKNFAPTGASMGISLQSMGAGLAYLTDRGNSAEVASTRLTMGLSMATAGSKAANTYMKDLGLTTGKLDLQNKSLQKTMEAGGLTTNKFAADLKKPDGLYVALSDMQGAFHKAGLSASQADAVMAKIFGGGRSDKAIVSLMQNLDGVRQKYQQIGEGVRNYGKDVSAEQATAQQKWKDFLATSQNLATGFGNALLPAFTKVAGFAASLLQGHGGAVAGVLGGAAALFTGKKLVSGVGSAVQTGESALRGVGKIAEVLHIPGLDKLANIGKAGGVEAAMVSGGRTAAAEIEAAMVSGGRTAAAEIAGGGAEGAAGKAGGAAAGAGRAEGAAAGAAEGEAAAGGASRFRGPAMTAGLGALAALTIVDPILKSMRSGPGGKNWLDNPFGMPGPNDPRSRNNWLTSFSPYERLFNTGRAPAPPPAVQASGAPSPGFAGRFGPSGPAIAPQIDTSKAKSSLSQFTSTLAQAMGKPVKMPAPDISALTGAKGKAAADAKAIEQSIETALKKPAKAAPPDISAYRAAIGPARTDGAAVSSGFAAGIRAGMGAAVAAASAVASAAAAAMSHAVQARSPSKVTEKIGKDTAAGFVVGLEGGKSAVDAAAKAIGKNVAKAADIASIDSTIAKLKKDVSGNSGLVKMLTADQGKLTALANTRARIEAEITDAQQVAQSAISGASILNAATYTPAMAAAGGPQSAQGLISGMQDQAADAASFAKEIGRLQKQHLNATTLSQIVQAGPSQGLPIAQGIDSGGRPAIAALNKAEASVIGSAKKLGSAAAPSMYQAGVSAGQGLAAGIESQLSGVEAAISKMASAIVSRVKKDLKAHSPAEVMVPPGMSIPQGVALGIDRGTGTAMSAMGRMGGRLAAWHPPAGYGHPAAGGSYGGGGGQVVIHNHYAVTVQGNVHTENDLLAALQNRQLVKASNNWQGGWQLPGRAG